MIIFFADMTNQDALSTLGRFYVYALHGCATEVLFTAAWEFIINYNMKLPGITSVWSFPIYGLSSLAVEQIYLIIKPLGVPLVLRCAVYTVWTYIWELSIGFLLRQIDACPWDYTPFHGDFIGLVTLEYLPLWFFGSMFLEQIVIYYTRRLFFGPALETTEGHQLHYNLEKMDNGKNYHKRM